MSLQVLRTCDRHLLFLFLRQFTVFNNVVKDAKENYFSNIVSNNQRHCTTNNILILVLTVPIFSVDECINFLSFNIGKIDGIRANIIPTALQYLTLFHAISLEELTSLVRNMKTSQAPLNTAFFFFLNVNVCSL